MAYGPPYCPDDTLYDRDAVASATRAREYPSWTLLSGPRKGNPYSPYTLRLTSSVPVGIMVTTGLRLTDMRLIPAEIRAPMS